MAAHGISACIFRDMRITELRGQKMTSGQIARELGVSRHHVEWRLRRLKIPSLSFKGRNPENSPWNDKALRERVKELHGLGLVITEIGKCVGLSKNTIIGFCYRTGLRRRMDKTYPPTPNPFPEPGICLWPGDSEDIVFDCSEHQHKYLDRTGELVSSPYCKEHHRRTHLGASTPKPAGVPQEHNVVKVA
jgi:hypothetical protein